MAANPSATRLAPSTIDIARDALGHAAWKGRDDVHGLCGHGLDRDEPEGRIVLALSGSGHQDDGSVDALEPARVRRRTPLYLGSAATVLVTSLSERNGAGDPLIAHRTVERLATLPADSGHVYLELPILHLSALVSQHRGDEAAYRDFADRYCTSSTALGFDAHIAIARAMR